MSVWWIGLLFVLAIALVAGLSWWSISAAPREVVDRPGEVEVYRRSHERGGL